MRKEKLRIILIVIGFILGLIFLFSGVSKILWSHAFERSLKMYRLDISETIEKCIRIFLPFAEISLGIILLINKMRDLAYYTVIILLTIFTTAQTWVIFHGWNVPCGCFGPYIKDTIGSLTVSRNIIFMGLAILGVFINEKYNKVNL